MTRLTSISLAGTIGKNYYGSSRDPGVITKTIGTNSRDYSTMSLWEADLDNTSVYVANDQAVGECYNDSVFGPVTINGGSTIGLKSITLKAAAGEQHDGTAGTGVRIQSTAHWQAQLARLGSQGSGMPIKVEGIELDRMHNSAFAIAGSGATYSHNKSFTKCIIHSSYNPTTNGFIAINADFWYTFAANNVAYNVRYGISSNNIYTGSKFVNNTIITSTGSAFYVREANQARNTVKNNIFIRNSGDAIELLGSIPHNFPEWDSNMSNGSSGYGANSYTETSLDNMFISNVLGSEDYHLRSQFDYENYSPAVGLGVNISSLSMLSGEDIPQGFGPGIGTQDIDSLSRGSVWDIGADQTPTKTTKTIGTNSRDYSTISLWEADLDNSSIYFYEDRAIGECYNDSTFYESLTIDNGGGVGLYSIELIAAQSDRHDGTAGTGVTITPTSSYAWSQVTTGVPVSFEYLIFDQNNYYGVTLTNNYSSYLFRMSRCIIHSGLNWMLRNSGNLMVDNSIFYNSSNSGVQGASLATETGGTTDSINNTFADHVYGIKRHGGTITSVNCISASSPSRRISDFYGTITQKYNLSSDVTATGTGSITSQAYGTDMFKSILSGSEDYHLNLESSAVRSGYNALSDYSSYSTIAIDIDGIRRSEMQDWDIGADQTASGGGMLLLGIG